MIAMRYRRKIRRWWKRKALKWHPGRRCEEHGRVVNWSTGRTRSKRGAVFCSPACKEARAHPTRAYRKAKDERQKPKCPKPWKLSFETEAECTEHFVDLMKIDALLLPYLCRCGQWHAGHSSYPPDRLLKSHIEDLLDPEVRAKLEALAKEEGEAS